MNDLIELSPPIISKKIHFASGFLLLDKPFGITSNAALQQVKKILHIKKAGHTGSLDPLATGMLPLCIDKATKFSGYLLDTDKQYEVCAQLGACTTTGDAEGEITARYPIGNYSDTDILSVLERFSGKIEQMPPMFSAIKKNGRPLYELARQGITIERDMRTVDIYQLNLLDIQTDCLSLFVHCSKGTYIRTLIEDIGNTLGCGAHVKSLRRTAVGKYLPSQMVTLDHLEALMETKDYETIQSFILPVDSCLAQWPSVTVNSQLLFYLQRGQSVRIKDAPSNGLVRLYSPSTEFLGLGEIVEDGRVAPRKLV
jgi:tRNA pseudouridine55 synthase